MERLTDKDTNKIGFDAWELCGLDSVCKRDCWKPAPCKIPKIVRCLAELEDKIENGTLIEATTLIDFINGFIDYLLKSEAECGDTERENIEACIYQEIFQVFGRKVEKQLGIKVFEDGKENGN